MLNRVTAGILILMSCGVVAAAFRMGTKTLGMRLAFGRDDRGNMYLFDYESPAFLEYLGRRLNIIGVSTVSGILAIFSGLYNSEQEARQIALIDNSHVIEEIMEAESVYPYVRKIIRVQSISRGISRVRIHLTLLQEDGSELCTSVVIPKTYEQFNGLIYSRERLYL